MSHSKQIIHELVISMKRPHILQSHSLRTVLRSRRCARVKRYVAWMHDARSALVTWRHLAPWRHADLAGRKSSMASKVGPVDRRSSGVSHDPNRVFWYTRTRDHVIAFTWWAYRHQAGDNRSENMGMGRHKWLWQHRNLPNIHVLYIIVSYRQFFVILKGSME